MAEQKNNQQKQGSDLNELLQVRREKLAALQAEGKNPFQITKYDQTHHSAEIKDNFDAMEGKEVSVAGRIMQKRVMGKASFCDVQDKQGRIQAYVTRDEIGEDSYKDFKKMDIGDIIGVKGKVFRTKMGEVSIHAESVVLLSKNLVPLPEKFHGLQDTDVRYRQRYLDLIMNSEVRDTFVKRSQIISEIRRFLDAKGFMEVETPMLVENAGGAAARPFMTHYNALNEDVKLRISLELYLKRLIVGGLERVYEIGRVFRNEGVDTRHNPEFTLMELYQAYTDYNGMMELTEELFRDLAVKVVGSARIMYQGTEIDMESPFRKVSMIDAVKEFSGVDFNEIHTDEEAKAIAREKGVAFEERHKRGDIINLFFDAFCEEKMIQPTFVIDHPVEVSPLTKRKPDDPSLVERFELYIYGREMCNAYSELNDPVDQRERFAAQDALAAAGDEEANHTDEDFLHAMEIGMPPTGGIGYGIDRLVMLLTDSAAIRDVLLFPTMKSLNADKNSAAGADGAAAAGTAADDGSEAGASAAEGADTAAAASAAATGFFTPNDRIDFSNVKIEPLFEEQVDFETFSKSDFRAVKVQACEAVKKSKKLLKFTLDDGTGTDRVILSGIHAYYEPEELVGKTLLAITNLPPRKMMGIDSCGMLLSAVNNKKDSEEEELHLIMLDNHIPAGAKLY